jgi:hypothetical protein
MSNLKKLGAKRSCSRDGRRGTLAGHGDRLAARPDALQSAFEPTAAWRTLRAEHFGAEDRASLRRALANTVLFGKDKSKWSEALAGNVPAAVSVAVSFIPVDEITVQLDLAMTVLTLFAIDGDPAAAIVLSNILRHMPGAHAHHRQIAASWFVSNLAAAASVAKRRRKAPRDTVTFRLGRAVCDGDRGGRS